VGGLRAGDLRSLRRVPPTISYCEESSPKLAFTPLRTRLTLSQLTNLRIALVAEVRQLGFQPLHKGGKGQAHYYPDALSGALLGALTDHRW